MEQLAELIKREDIDQLSQSEGLTFDDDRIAILESMRSIDVQACPGSGKTTLIAAKLMLLAKKWPLSGQGICVLSHTNVAKDEIIERLKRSKTPEAQRLLSYPHFIGTIQEFINKFVALPYIRSEDQEINLICGTEEQKPYFFQAIKELRIAAQINSKFLVGNSPHQFSSSELREESISTVHLSLDQSKICFFQKPNGNTVQRNFDSDLNCTEINQGNILYKIKRHMTDSMNVFSYNDMYRLASKALSENPIVPKLTNKRFPFVFIDEMQDTQKFQDELLCQIFPLGDSCVTVQRFGDPDQAIFNIGNEEANESFNGKKADDMDFVVNKSHRFDEVLAAKIKPLSVNQITLSSELSGEALADRSNICSQEDGFQHSILVFDNDTIDGVIQSFANVVTEQFQNGYKASERFTVKIVGAVGKEIDSQDDNQLRIAHYWDTYHKSKAKNSLKLETLIDIARHIRKASTVDFSGNYKTLIDGIIKWLSLSGKLDNNGRGFTTKSLQQFLKEEDKWVYFRNYVYSLLVNKSSLTQQRWEEACNELKAIFELQDLPDKAGQYLNYSEEISDDENIGVSPSEGMISLPENKIRHPYGFDIHLSTIHGVKGETHDATLVLETKNHSFDLEAMLPYITNNLPSAEHPQENLPEKPHHSRGFKPNKLFSRQLYVAASRPRHLLCIAMHSSGISDEQKQALDNLGWKIIPLSQERGSA